MTTEYRLCNCIGPQNGQPRCPCMMRGVIERDGRWIEPEKDLGPVLPTAPYRMDTVFTSVWRG